jgi:hypothetical protein
MSTPSQAAVDAAKLIIAQQIWTWQRGTDVENLGAIIGRIQEAIDAELRAEREYRQLLSDELDEVAAFIPSCWKSSRYDKGVELRRKLGIPKETDPTC